MEPISKRRRCITKTTTKVTTSTKIITRSIYKKQQMSSRNQDKPSTINKVEFDQSSRLEDPKVISIINKSSIDDNGCSTPKSNRYKIPEIVTCPPAPKKPKVSPSNDSFVQTRRPITFFAHPDLDKFFLFASRDIKV